MKPMHRFQLVGLPSILMVLAAQSASAGAAEVKKDGLDWLKVSGYAAIAYTQTHYNDESNVDTFADGGAPFDAVKVGFEGTYSESLGSYVSLFYTPGLAADDAGILDAYAFYKFGSGFTVTAGKYLSWLGYEAFDTINMTQITYANTLGAIPAYHNGVKLEYANDVVSTGVNVSDSIRGEPFWTGDEDFSDDQGYEAYVSYKGIDKLTLWAGVAYENTSQLGLEDFVTYDFWTSYDITDKLTAAAEVAYHDSGPRGIQSLAFLKYAFTDKFSTVLRYGMDDFATGGVDNKRYTISPTYAFTDSFLVRGEVSYNDTQRESVFSGLQAVMKF